jgi:hypothetical protein
MRLNWTGITNTHIIDGNAGRSDDPRIKDSTMGNWNLKRFVEPRQEVSQDFLHVGRV